MNGIRIIGTGRAVPNRRLTNDDLSRMVETNDEWIRTRTGICERRICEGETTASLAAEAAKGAVEAACELCGAEDGRSRVKEDIVEYIKNQIAVVLVATTTPDYAFP